MVADLLLHPRRRRRQPWRQQRQRRQPWCRVSGHTASSHLLTASLPHCLTASLPLCHHSCLTAFPLPLPWLLIRLLPHCHSKVNLPCCNCCYLAATAASPRCLTASPRCHLTATATGPTPASPRCLLPAAGRIMSPETRTPATKHSSSATNTTTAVVQCNNCVLRRLALQFHLIPAPLLATLPRTRTRRIRIWQRSFRRAGTCHRWLSNQKNGASRTHKAVPMVCACFGGWRAAAFQGCQQSSVLSPLDTADTDPDTGHFHAVSNSQKARQVRVCVPITAS